MANFIRGLLINHGSNISAWQHGIAHGQATRSLNKSVQERVMRAVHHNHATARGTFLSAKTKRALAHAKHRLIKVGAGVNNDCVLAAHFAHNFFHGFLLWCDHAARLNNVKTNALAAGERDQRHARIAHQRRANFFAKAGQESQALARNSRAPQNVAHDFCNAHGLFRGFHRHGVASHQRGNGHAAANSQRKIPRTNDGAHAARLIGDFIQFAHKTAQSGAVKQASGLARVVLAEINRFANVAVGFAPCFASLANNHAAQFVAASAHGGRGLHQSFRALSEWPVTPRGIRRRKQAHGVARDLRGNIFNSNRHAGFANGRRELFARARHGKVSVWFGKERAAIANIRMGLRKLVLVSGQCQTFLLCFIVRRGNIFVRRRQ